MFFDQAKIYIRSGNGGDGMISFRREKHVPLGGPDGGDGGDGGSIIFAGNRHLNSLMRFNRQAHFKADHGVHGSKANRHGKRGENLRIEVPAGTIIREAETGNLLADITSEDQEILVLQGGKGGRGNARFASSVNQAPRIAERGEPGEELWVTLELKLIADVGIVGVPNAGKSTLLSVISGATPKVANYPFTTLQPNLGVVEMDDFETFVVADIPGLIEGAASGVGLGHDFLRHVERTRVLIHLLDGSAKEPLEDWAMINQELALYDIALEKRPQLVVLNKMDLPDAIAWEPLIEEEIKKAGYPFMAISAATQQNVRQMLYRVRRMLDEAPPAQTRHTDEITVIRAENDEGFTIEREGDGWRVRGKQIERVAAMTYFEFDATVVRFQKILESMGISQALTEAGVAVGDPVYIGEEELEWGE
ncbi:MAG: GTPase ObgE [Ardenticatenaceae bacterium]|nr:GTPase ObgE [Anaerolineales bacterium]MCB8940309.1 GTPase ObgE [Ardenticatenaceae bacterium]MCB8973325.1 GTPase ObgE [Ardenticatenaceae bacterium]